MRNACQKKTDTSFEHRELIASRRRALRSVGACILLVLAAASRPHAQRRFDEREIKATFIFNFAQFVEWPAASFADPHAPLAICVLGIDPFDGALDAVIRGEVVNGHPLIVKRFRRVEDAATCHVLFVSPSEAPQYARIAEVLRGRAVLTIGESDGFVASGGVVRFITEKNRVRLRVNLGAARAAGLTISSQILRVADVVNQEEVP